MYIYIIFFLHFPVIEIKYNEKKNDSIWLTKRGKKTCKAVPTATMWIKTILNLPQENQRDVSLQLNLQISVSFLSHLHTYCITLNEIMSLIGDFISCLEFSQLQVNVLDKYKYHKLNSVQIYNIPALRILSTTYTHTTHIQAYWCQWTSQSSHKVLLHTRTKLKNINLLYFYHDYLIILCSLWLVGQWDFMITLTWQNVYNCMSASVPVHHCYHNII